MDLTPVAPNHLVMAENKEGITAHRWKAAVDAVRDNATHVPRGHARCEGRH